MATVEAKPNARVQNLPIAIGHGGRIHLNTVQMLPFGGTRRVDLDCGTA